jgi:hypothetical protein
MRDGKWIKLEELRQPGIRRVLEAMQLLEEEAPGLLDDAIIAATELTKGRDEGGRTPQ